ncbi:MAG: DUF1566 domain-containing protein [Dokdonella sp.]
MLGTPRVLTAALIALGFGSQAHAVTSCSAGNPNSTSVPESTPTSAFTDNLDGTVTHNLTGLIWKRCAEGQAWDGLTCSGTAATFRWAEALIQSKNANFAGQIDWRLPNQKELMSIVEYCGYVPAINTIEFPGAPSASFWSGSAYTSFAWYVDFTDGATNINGNLISLDVRLVRGGRPIDSFDAQILFANGFE